ncbi:MAG: amidohydrolase family protein [Parachlamydiaceae bacterium]|nr:amidohydrolase family protein [Parachlamydiaceae bacterium]
MNCISTEPQYFEDLTPIQSLYTKDASNEYSADSGLFSGNSKDQFFKNPITSLPIWAEGDVDKYYAYYAYHEVTRLDRLILNIANYFGIIIHGKKTQIELDSHLKCFDIQKLLIEGPYENPILSTTAQMLIYDNLNDIEKVYDIHLHNLGFDEDNFLNPKASAFGVATHLDYIKFSLLRYACGITSPQGSTNEARKRLYLYASHFPKLIGVVLPFHKAILGDGKVDWDNTGSYISNHTVLKTAGRFESLSSELLPATSIHPLDPQWREKLFRAHAKGIRLVKWVPPQSIKPDTPLFDNFYRMMKQLDMTLIAHVGPEHTIPTTESTRIWVDWGNPLRFRKPLKLGVNVILSHCGHKDLIPDLDHPQRILVPGYQLYIRLAREAHQKNLKGEWKGKLYGDLAAVTTHYGPEFIRELLLLANEDGFRLIYGSDYPYTNLIKPRNDAYTTCSKAGLVDPRYVKPLQEIREWNPLLANYIFTRVLEFQRIDGEKIRFPKSIFNGEYEGAKLKLIDPVMWLQHKECSVF